MTIQEFDERDFSLDELYNLCNEVDNWDPFEETFGPDYVDEEINELLADAWSSMNDWRDLRDELDSVDLTGSWYIRGDYGYFSYTCVDDDEDYISEMKEKVKEVLLEYEWFEDSKSDDDFEHYEVNENWFEEADVPDLMGLL